MAHWTQTPEGKEKIRQIAAMGRASQGLAPSSGTAVKRHPGRPGKRSPAELKLMSQRMKEAWARRKAASRWGNTATGREALAGKRSPGRPRKDSEQGHTDIVAQVHTLAHGLADAQLNGGLTVTETHALTRLGKLIELHT